MSPSSRVLSAVAARLTRIICASPKLGLSVARSAMSSPCRCAEGTIARCIAVAMKALGGRKQALIRPLPPARYGWKPVRSQPVVRII